MWWLLAKLDGDFRPAVLTLGYGKQRVLPVFSGEGEAEMFVWFECAVEDGWWVRETSAGELVSILCGPCTDVGSIALDPPPGITAETIGLVSVGRRRFMDKIVASPATIGQ